MKPSFIPLAARARQRGAVLLLSLIILVVLLLSAVALVRSFDTSLFSAGNLAFKRDTVNQQERAFRAVKTAFDSVDLKEDTDTAQGAHSKPNNYSAAVLPSNAQGIPLALMDDALFATVALPANDITVASQGMTVRYVIDRMCTSTGAAKTLGASGCTLLDYDIPKDSSATQIQNAGVATGAVPCPPPPAAQPPGCAPPPSADVRPVFRISMRVTGPRNTQAFYQTTFTPPR